MRIKKLKVLPFAFVCFTRAALAQDMSSLYPPHPETLFNPAYQEFKAEGSVVLYARFWFGFQSANQEFVFKTDSEKMPLIRILYLPACCFDAPPVPPERIFGPRQFAIPGSIWRLKLHTPHRDWEKQACKSVQMTISIVDETGKVVREEPRFQAVAGRNQVNIPKLQTLPCLVLKEKGWQRLPDLRKPIPRH